MRSRFACIVGDRNSEASIRKIPPQQLSEARVVVDDEQMGFGAIGLATIH
jgi:hypothetical protein